MPTWNSFLRDQSGSISSQALAIVGPFTPVAIELPQSLAQVYIAQNRPPPSPVSGMALIDTGASRTVVDEAGLEQLGVSPVSVVNILTPAGPSQRNVYPARLHFPQLGGMTMDAAGVAGVDLGGQSIPLNPPQNLLALIGRDVLANWVFIYNGPGGFFTITF